MEWPEIGSQNVKEVKLGLGVIDISDEDFYSSETKKWILIEPRFPDEQIIQARQSSTFNHCYHLLAAMTPYAEHEKIPRQLRVSNKVDEIHGGGKLGKAERGLSLFGKSEQFGSVPEVLRKQLEKMMNTAWLPGARMDNLGVEPAQAVEPDLLLDPAKYPYEYYDGDVNLFWLRYGQVLQSCRKLHEGRASNLGRLERDYQEIVQARREHNSASA